MEEKNIDNKSNKSYKWIIGICLLILFIVIVYVLYNVFYNTEKKDVPSIDDGIKEEIDESKIKKYVANSPQEFVNYLKKIDYEDYITQDVIYDKIRFTRTQREYGYSYEIYYKDNEIFKNYDLIHGGSFYLFENNNNNAFVVINEIGPVGSSSRYLILIFDIFGNVLLSKTIIPIFSTEILVVDNTISYQFETSMQEEHVLGTMAENDENFCEYLNENYVDDYVVSGSHKYQYINGKLILTDKSENTIKNYKEKYNCN